ncbi:Glutaredoxin [uncultured archaeon]|nr:Glutaredoxin [uncultured archaeon]
MAKKATDARKGKREGIKVIMYSTAVCPYCRMAEEYLSKKGVDCKKVDVSSNSAGAREMMEKSGQMGVPVLDIRGKIIVGFDRDAIDAALSSG